MSNRRKYIHLIGILGAIIIGGLTLWHSGFLMEGRNRVPNFTVIAMVFVVISQGLALRKGLKQGGK